MRQVYALVDPRTKYPRYVGSTKYSLKSRLNLHIKCPISSTESWIKELKKEDKYPNIIKLEDGSYEDEQFWIDYLRFLGAELLNRKRAKWEYLPVSWKYEVKRRKQRAMDLAQKLFPIMLEIEKSGVITYKEMAEELNNRRMFRVKGGKWDTSSLHSFIRKHSVLSRFKNLQLVYFRIK